MNIYYFSHQLINENHKNWYSTNKEKPQSSNRTTVTIFFINHNNMLIHCSLPSPPTPKNKKNKNIYLFILPGKTQSNPLKSSNTEFLWSIQCSPAEWTI